MKIITIGDIHGKSYWEIPLLGYDPDTNTGSKTTIEDFDKVIFIGDYVDAYDISNVEMIHNLKKLMELAKKYPDKIIWLLGNHDLQYYFFNSEKYRCTGYRPEIFFDLYDIFNKNKKLFRVSYQIDNYVWTHAGIHIGWYKQRFEKWLDDVLKENRHHYNLSEQLNMALEVDADVLYDVGYLRGGFQNVGGPFWLDKRMSYKKPLKGYHQIVGHTRVDEIKTYNISKDTSITYVDNLDKEIDKFHILDLDI